MVEVCSTMVATSLLAASGPDMSNGKANSSINDEDNDVSGDVNGDYGDDESGAKIHYPSYNVWEDEL